MHQSQKITLLDECRDFLADRTCNSVAKMLKEIDETLFSALDERENKSAKCHYIDAIRELRTRRQEIKILYEKRFTNLFEEKVRKVTAEKNNTKKSGDAVHKITKSQNSLVSQETDCEVLDNCKQVLLALDRQIGFLLDDLQLPPHKNPVNPTLVYEAFQSVCNDLKSGDEIRTLLLKFFDKYISYELREIYEELNIKLARKDFMYQIKVDHKRPDVSSDQITGYISEIIDDEESEECQDIFSAQNPIQSRINTQIDKEISNYEVPDFVKTFLHTYWCNVLEKTYIRWGENSPEWKRMMQTVADLAKSVQLTHGTDESRELFWILPSLNYRLKSGMRSVSVPIDEQVQFLRTLKHYHSKLSENRTTYA